MVRRLIGVTAIVWLTAQGMAENPGAAVKKQPCSLVGYATQVIAQGIVNKNIKMILAHGTAEAEGDIKKLSRLPDDVRETVRKAVYKCAQDAYLNSIEKLGDCYYLDLSRFPYPATPDLRKFTHLHHLQLDNNQLTTVDAHLLPPSLEKLHLDGNAFVHMPDLHNLVSVNELRLCNNNLGTLDAALLPPQLRCLYLEKNAFAHMPDLHALRLLCTIHMGNNHLSTIDVARLPPITTDLFLNNNDFVETPDVRYTNICRLNLRKNHLTAVNETKLSPSLYSLDLADNLLSEIPRLNILARLRHLSLRNNPLTTLAMDNLLNGVTVFDHQGRWRTVTHRRRYRFLCMCSPVA